MADQQRSTENGNGSSDSDEVSNTDSVEFDQDVYRDGGDDTDGEDVESEESELVLMPYQLQTSKPNNKPIMIDRSMLQS